MEHCLLTTFCWDGAPIEKRVRLSAGDRRLYVRLTASGEEARRVWNSASVRIAPCTRMGRPLGPAVEAAARVVPEHEEPRAARALSKRADDELYVEIVPTEWERAA